MSSMSDRRAALYAHIIDKVIETAAELGLAGDLGEHLGAAIVDAIAQDFGGQVLSFPKDDAYRLSRREQAILAARSQGASIHELARQFGMTERGIAKLLKRVFARQTGPEQPRLL
ncbi:MAG: hypothetical protein JSR26_04125 [Proteobacteria bacterium]|nr:hypothetical protein [Pseudomonadota bacterium]